MLPDLGQPPVQHEIAAWADRGESAVVGALLNAARYAGADALSVMKGILRPVLAELWLTDRKLLAYFGPRVPRRRLIPTPGEAGPSSVQRICPPERASDPE